MAKDTTNSGVSDEKSADEFIAEQGSLDRDSDLNDIVANAKITRELEASGVDMNNPMEVSLAKDKISNGVDPDPNAGLDDPGSNYDNPDPEMIMVKVNGIEKNVLKSDVDAEGGVVSYQKNRSADEKMRQNADSRRQLDAREAELAQRELAISQQEQAQLSNKDLSRKPSSDASGPSDEAVALKDKMYSGDESQAAEAIDTILERGNNSTHVDANEIANQAAALVERKNEISQGKKMFAETYSDIDSNPEYRSYANRATVRIGDENPHWTIPQILVEAGEQARLKFRSELREVSDNADTEKRMSNKRTTDNVRGTGARVANKPAEKPKTRSEVVKGMMSGRSHAEA